MTFIAGAIIGIIIYQGVRRYGLAYLKQWRFWTLEFWKWGDER